MVQKFWQNFRAWAACGLIAGCSPLVLMPISVAAQESQDETSEAPNTSDASAENPQINDPAGDSAGTPPAESTIPATATAGDAEGAATSDIPPVGANAEEDQEFYALFVEWKAMLKKLRDIRAEYLIADEADLEGLQQSWETTGLAAEKMLEDLKIAAADGYNAAPNSDRELVRFLVSVLQDRVMADDYVPANELAVTLVKGGSEEKELRELAGISAYGMNDFDLAEEQLRLAEENGTITDKGSAILATIDEVKELWVEELELREAEADDNLPHVRLQTDTGDIVLELFENEAPETVGNFISLVEKGFYDQLAFHRVLPGFMAQGGCPNGDGTGGPGYNIYCECVNDNHRKHFAGSLSMAKTPAVNTGGSQFFVTFQPTPQLNGKHTVFGRVIEGLDVLPTIVRQDPQEKSAQPEPTKILKAEVVRKRDHEYRPNKVK